MKKLILAAVCAVLLAAAPLCAAQKNPVQKYSAHTLSENISTDVLALSMKDAIRTALSENITVRKASEDVTRARGDSKARLFGAQTVRRASQAAPANRLKTPSTATPETCGTQG
jgi:hypothetical protein